MVIWRLNAGSERTSPAESDHKISRQYNGNVHVAGVKTNV